MRRLLMLPLAVFSLVRPARGQAVPLPQIIETGFEACQAKGKEAAVDAWVSGSALAQPAQWFGPKGRMASSHLVTAVCLLLARHAAPVRAARSLAQGAPAPTTAERFFDRFTALARAYDPAVAEWLHSDDGR